jgi:hypothetical protein
VHATPSNLVNSNAFLVVVVDVVVDILISGCRKISQAKNVPF